MLAEAACAFIASPASRFKTWPATCWVVFAPKLCVKKLKSVVADLSLILNVTSTAPELVFATETLLTIATAVTDIFKTVVSVASGVPLP